MKIIELEEDTIYVSRCGECVRKGINLFCYELERYVDNLDIIQPDCPLPDEKE